MSVTYHDFIASAEAMNVNPSLEVDRRTAASRAYYGVYHCALQTANSVGSDAPLSSFSGSSHEKLRCFYSDENMRDEFAKRRRAVGYMLKQAHMVRCLADYRLSEDFSDVTLEAHLIACKRIIDKISLIADEVEA